MRARMNRLMPAVAGASFVLGIISCPAGAQSATSSPKLVGQHVRDLGYIWHEVPRNNHLHIRVVGKFTTPEVPQRVRCDGVAMTGAYIKRDADIPDGLLVADGQRYGSDNGRTDGGVLTISGGTVTLRRVKDFRASADTSPTQVYSQPILIFNGAVDWGLTGQQKTNRVALGKYRDGGLFMVMAQNTDRGGMSAVTLGQFAADVLALAKRPIDWLVNFDGGPSAFLYSPTEQSYVPGNGYVISYFCAERDHG